MTSEYQIPNPDYPMVQLLGPDGKLTEGEVADRYADKLAAIDEALLKQFWQDMVVSRRFDRDAANLQRQGQLALWIPSFGQEAAQVGSARATRMDDHVFPAYREHIVGIIRGVDPVQILSMLRGVTHGGWDPKQCNNFHLYTVVLASQTLHATGYAMGLQLDGVTATGNPETDQAVIVYFGDGSSSQGDASEAMLFASSYQTPQVFFIQNNQWAISVPVRRQTRVALAERGRGFGMPGIRLDGNDVLASYLVTNEALAHARAGNGPSLIEALTYRLGAHTTADDPTKYRPEGELEYWHTRDPLIRYEQFLKDRGVEASFFIQTEEYANDLAADVRARALDLPNPTRASMFKNVYSEPHPVTEAQLAWLDAYEASFGGGQ